MTPSKVPQAAIDAGKAAYGESIANGDNVAETVAKIIAAAATAAPELGGPPPTDPV